jgi:hypothetical protein
MSHPARLKIVLLAIGLFLIAGAGGLVLRLRRTVEYRVHFGPEPQRLAVCRSIPLTHPRRQERLLLRLLADESPEVRSSAVTAAGRCRETPAVNERLLVLVLDTGETGTVRDKAGVVLLARQGPAPTRLRQRLRAHMLDPDPALDLACPDVVARHLVDAWRRGEADGAAVLRRALAPADPLGDRLRDLLPGEPAALQALRPSLVAELARLEGDPAAFRRQRFLLACLQAVDGAMRGASAADWAVTDASASDAIDGHVFEAEWATAIEPNYQIGTFNGRLCLTLGEGAGGIISWLKGERGSVDIGKARLSCVIAESGPYRVWARVYLDDKCGNSFGFELAGQALGGFSDHHDVLGQWHWLMLTPTERGTPDLFLQKGIHPIRLEAWEDAVYIDKFAVLRPGDDPSRYDARTNHHWLPGAGADVSLAPEWQAQPRGTRQRLAVWVLRPTPTLTGGTVTLTLPPPFQIASANPTQVLFAPGQPLARTSFEIELPADAVGGEVLLRAVFLPEGAADSAAATEAQILLGAQYDWLTTGPLAPEDRRHLALSAATRLTDEQLRTGWSRYPLTGYDPYRRLTPESAYGQLQNRYLYFCTDIEVGHAGNYVALLTADDEATVWLDGTELVSQPRPGPAEGRLVMQPVRLEAGRHRLLARLFQADFADVDGPSASRHTQNNCAFKLLLRRDRHEPVPEIRGLPMVLPAP